MWASTPMKALARAATTPWVKRMGAASLDSPVGPLTIWEEAGEITRLDWTRGPDLKAESPEVLHEAVAQMGAYFAGTLTVFDLPLQLGPSAFQAIFQNRLLDIPFGETLTYGDLSRLLEVPAQAIGQACGANRIPIIVPCHRVLGANGLGGFSGRGGVEAKVALLRHEGAAGLLI